MDSYEVLELIGRGNYGEVYVCKNIKNNNEYVMKKIVLINHSLEEKKNIENEVLVLKKLNHPNIVNYIDSFYDKNKNFIIIMDYCKDGDLYKKIREKEGILIKESVIINWVSQLCLGIHYLHDIKILHRDLKSQNIFLNDNNLYFGDFGISKVLSSTYELAQTYIGTPYYMSPELFDNRPYSYKSDIWSLGCIVYEMCTKKNPFNAQTINMLALNIQKGVYQQISSYYSSNLKELIKSLLNTNPKMRPNIKQIINKDFIKKEIINHIKNLIYKNEYNNSSKNQLKIQLIKWGIYKILEQDIEKQRFDLFFNNNDNKNEDKINLLQEWRKKKQYEISNILDLNVKYKDDISFLKEKLQEKLKLKNNKKNSKMRLYKDYKCYEEEYKEISNFSSDLEEIKEIENDFDDEEIKNKIEEYQNKISKNKKKINGLEKTIKETTKILNKNDKELINNSDIFDELTESKESSIDNSQKELESPFFISEIENSYDNKNIHDNNLIIVNKLKERYKTLE